MWRKTKKPSEEELAAQAALKKRLGERLKSVSDNRRANSIRVIDEEKRDGGRQNICNLATMTFETGREISCLALDRSPSGLRLRLQEHADLPDEMVLQIPSLNFVGVVRPLWKIGANVGCSVKVWCEAA